MKQQRRKPLLAAVMVLAASWSVGEPGAHAGTRAQFRLVYERLTGASPSCPPVEALAISLRQRLGYDPTDFRAKELIEVVLSTTPARRSAGRGPTDEVTVTVTWLAPNGQRRGERVLTGRSERCAALVKDAALAIALAVDPEAVEAMEAGQRAVRLPRRSASLASVRRPRNTATEPTPQGPAAAPRLEPVARGIGMDFGAIISVILGREGQPVSLAGAVTMALGADPWAVYARANLSGVWPQPVGSGGRLDVLTPTGEIGACGRFRPLSFCGIAAIGEVIARGLSSDGEEVTRRGLYATTGLRVQARLASDGPVVPVAELLVGVPLTPVRLVADGESLYTAWPVTVGLGVGAYFSASK